MSIVQDHFGALVEEVIRVYCLISEVLILNGFIELTNVVHSLQNLIEVDVLLVCWKQLSVLVHEELH